MLGAATSPDFSGLLTRLVHYGLHLCGRHRLRLPCLQPADGHRWPRACLKDMRDDMFAHMQTLPIRYFDTHSHGDIMSHYTNDTDTLRQMIAQSLPQTVLLA